MTPFLFLLLVIASSMGCGNRTIEEKTSPKVEQKAIEDPDAISPDKEQLVFSNSGLGVGEDEEEDEEVLDQPTEEQEGAPETQHDRQTRSHSPGSATQGAGDNAGDLNGGPASPESTSKKGSGSPLKRLFDNIANRLSPKQPRKKTPSTLEADETQSPSGSKSKKSAFNSNIKKRPASVNLSQDGKMGEKRNELLQKALSGKRSSSTSDLTKFSKPNQPASSPLSRTSSDLSLPKKKEKQTELPKKSVKEHRIEKEKPSGNSKPNSSQDKKNKATQSKEGGVLSRIKDKINKIKHWFMRDKSKKDTQK